MEAGHQGVVEVSEATDAKAAKLVRTGKVGKVGDLLYQVAGSRPGASYMVDMNDHSCECLGFRYKRDCSHLEAVRIFSRGP